MICGRSILVYAAFGFQEGCAYERMGLNVLFVYLSSVFLEVTEICIFKCPEDVQTCFCFCVDILYVLSERQSLS